MQVCCIFSAGRRQIWMNVHEWRSSMRSVSASTKPSSSHTTASQDTKHSKCLYSFSYPSLDVGRLRAVFCHMYWNPCLSFVCHSLVTLDLKDIPDNFIHKKVFISAMNAITVLQY